METIELRMPTAYAKMEFTQKNAKIIIDIINANMNADASADANTSSSKNEDKKLKDSKLLFKSPNNTALFLNWLEEQHVSEFNIDDFVNKYSSISRELAEKIIAHQIHLGRLIQLSKDKIRVVKNPPVGEKEK